MSLESDSSPFGVRSLERDSSPVAASSEQCSSPSAASKSPDTKRVKCSPLTQFLNHGISAKSNVMEQGCVHIKKTPHPDKRRFRDATTIVSCGLDQLGSMVFNNSKWTREDRTRMMKPHVLKYFRKNFDGNGKHRTMLYFYEK